MRNWVKVAVFLMGSSIGLSGCGVAYNSNSAKLMKTTPAEAWGAPPPAGHASAEENFIKARLKDPESARFQRKEPHRGTIPASQASARAVPVWIVEVNVNAKNSYGGYTGYQLYQFSYSNGKLVAVFGPDLWSYLGKL